MTKLPQVSHERVVRALKRAGFYILQEGKHIALTDDKHIVIVSRQRHRTGHPQADSGRRRDLPRAIQRTLLNAAASAPLPRP